MEVVTDRLTMSQRTEIAARDLMMWLRTQIAEREAAARAAMGFGRGEWKRDGCYVVDEADERVVYDEGSPNEDQAEHIALNDPRTVLAQCEAHTALLALAKHARAAAGWAYAEPIVEVVASAYRHSPGYRPEWKP